MKCSICSNKIETNFLNKMIGTYINKKSVCPECQKKFKTKEALLANLK